MYVSNFCFHTIRKSKYISNCHKLYIEIWFWILENIYIIILFYFILITEIIKEDNLILYVHS